jgi:hypothetical protein
VLQKKHLKNAPAATAERKPGASARNSQSTPVMTGYTFAPAAVARAAALFRDGLDPQSVRLRIFHEHPELTGFGVDRVLEIARGAHRRDIPGATGQG